MDQLSNAWFVLDLINKLAMPFGLSFPLEIGKKTTSWTKEKRRKITSLVLFVVVCMSLLSIRDLFKNNKASVIPSFIIASSTCCLILGKRYSKLQDTSSVLETMLTVKYPQAFPRGRTLLLEIFKRNWALLLKTISLLSIISMKIYLSATLHGIFRTILDLILITECLLITCILDIIHKLIEFVEANVTQLYSEFYKAPPAELKKTDNGDFILLGWIYAALAQRTNRTGVDLLEKNLIALVGLADALDVLNEISSSAVSAVILVGVADLVEESCGVVALTKDSQHFIVDVALQLHLWACLWGIFWKCGNIGDGIRSLGNTAFKLYVDIPSRVFLLEEVEFKNILYLVYEFAMNGSWYICLFKTIEINPRVYVKILMSILLIYFVVSIIRKYSY